MVCQHVVFLLFCCLICRHGFPLFLSVFLADARGGPRARQFHYSTLERILPRGSFQKIYPLDPPYCETSPVML